MIEVKIARNLGRDGVEGLRWVLLDPLEPGASATAMPQPLPQPAGAAATVTAAKRDGQRGKAGVGAAMAAHAAVASAPPDHIPGSPRQTLMLAALKTLVLLLALGAAVATAWRVIGPPRLPGDRALPRPLPASQSQPVASAPVLTARAAQAAPSQEVMP